MRVSKGRKQRLVMKLNVVTGGGDTFINKIINY